MGLILKTMWRDFWGYDTKPRVNYRDTHAEFVSREEWGAEPPKSVIEFHELMVPISVAFVRPTGTRECRDRRSCIRVMREMQQRDMADDMPDIQHNFYIGGDGDIYEGRGWKHMRSQMDEDDLAVNSSISIGVIGPWKVPNEMPPSIMVSAAIHLIELGSRLGHLTPDCLYQTILAKHTV